MHSFFARSNYSALPHPHLPQHRATGSSANAMPRLALPGPSWAGAITQHSSALYSQLLVLHWTPRAGRPGTVSRTSLKREETLARGKQERLKPEVQSQQNIFPAGITKARFPKQAACSLCGQGQWELHWESRYDGVNTTEITFMQTTTWYRLDNHRHLRRGWPETVCYQQNVSGEVQANTRKQHTFKNKALIVTWLEDNTESIRRVPPRLV